MSRLRCKSCWVGRYDEQVVGGRWDGERERRRARLRPDEIGSKKGQTP
jgi:hypothetical protein